MEIEIWNILNEQKLLYDERIKTMLEINENDINDFISGKDPKQIAETIIKRAIG